MSKIILSIDNWWDMHTLKMFTKRCDELKAMSVIKEVRPMIGSFEGELVLSFSLEEEALEHLVEFIEGQTCILVVTEGVASLVYKDRHEFVGYFVPSVDKPDGDFTYDPSTRLYYTLEGN